MLGLRIPTSRRRVDLTLLILGFWMASLGSPANAQSIELRLRKQIPVAESVSRFHREERSEAWVPERTAVIVCDMWDSHHCVNAVRRVAELAPRIDRFCNTLRDRGVTIVHAPSSCVKAYADHPARQRMSSIPGASHFPADIGNWCDQIPSEEQAAYPLDQSAGGEDDEEEDHHQWAERLASIGRNPKAPWERQTDAIGIDADKDFISDSGNEIWSLLTSRQIDNVILVGVHTNMCVLGRPFGLRRLAAAGKNVVLARDLTDTMYDPRAWPYVSHFSGTDLIIDHIERYVCPTIASDQVLNDEPMRFTADRRPTLLMLVAEDEYQTETSLPAFAAKHLSDSFRVEYAWGSETERNQIVGIDQIRNADALLISVRRRALPAADLELIRSFIQKGKPVVGIRTANHAFSLRGKTPPPGAQVWDNFDADVWGGNYTNHHGSSLRASLLRSKRTSQGTSLAEGPSEDANRPVSVHPILAATDPSDLRPSGSLYKVSPLAAGTRVLLEAEVPGQPAEPIAWTFVRSDAGRSFYTSLGHPDDFGQPAFEALLAAGIHWACGLPAPTLTQITKQNRRYAAGSGKQR